MQPKQQKQEPVASPRLLAAAPVHAEFQIADYSQCRGGWELVAVRFGPMAKIMNIKCDNCCTIIILKGICSFLTMCSQKYGIKYQKKTRNWTLNTRHIHCQREKIPQKCKKKQSKKYKNDIEKHLFADTIKARFLLPDALNADDGNIKRA